MSAVRVRERPPVVWALLLVLGQLAVRATVGGTALLLDPSGALVGLNPGELDPLPFGTFLVPGLMLAGALGLFPAVVCYWLAAGWRRAPLAAAGVGVALFGWLLVEAVAGFDRPTAALNLATAVATLALAAHPSVRNAPNGDERAE